MEMAVIIQWMKGNPLTVVAVGVTLVFIYNYMMEREHTVKLSKKYRNSIYETQSKIFLNASQHLILGNKDLAIKEFLNAVDLNRETIETYFALGQLFRSNGEIEKAIGIHRSLIARDNINESTRLEALKELAIDFDKGGFIDKALETYKDVLKINRDQFDVIKSLCRIYEDVEEWDEAYNYRIMLSKVDNENQAETISHILVQKAKKLFDNGDYKHCYEELEDAFRFAPSVSAKILRLKLFIVNGNIEESKSMLVELLKEHPIYATFIFVSLDEFKIDAPHYEAYQQILLEIKNHFLDVNDAELFKSPAIILSKVWLLKSRQKNLEAANLIDGWMTETGRKSEVLQMEYIKLLVKLNRDKEALNETEKFLDKLNSSLTMHYCSHCGYSSDEIFWRCPQCHNWETIQFRWKV
jgi:lipopolysaccharide biosynthesis regulator YciM